MLVWYEQWPVDPIDLLHTGDEILPNYRGIMFFLQHIFSWANIYNDLSRRLVTSNGMWRYVKCSQNTRTICPENLDVHISGNCKKTHGTLEPFLLKSWGPFSGRLGKTDPIGTGRFLEANHRRTWKSHLSISRWTMVHIILRGVYMKFFSR